MAVMRQLCNKGLLLDHGRVLKTGTIGEVVDTYLAAGVEHEGHWQRQKPVPAKAHIFLESASVFNSSGVMSGHLDCTEDFTIEIKTQANATFAKGQIALSIMNKEGVIILTTCNSDAARKYVPITEGKHTYRIKIPGNFLAPDTYFLRIVAHEPYMELHDIVESTISFRIEDVGSLRSVFSDARVGIVEPLLAWTDTQAGDGGAK